MHDFVVRDRQHEVLTEGIKEAEGHLVVMPAAIDRIFRHVIERVVHPAHVPLEAESEAALVSRSRNAREGGRFFGDGDGPWKAAIDELVGATEKGDGFSVFLASVGVGQPFALLAGVVEVKHRGDGIDAQTVDVEAIDPVKCVAMRKLATSVRPKL